MVIRCCQVHADSTLVGKLFWRFKISRSDCFCYSLDIIGVRIGFVVNK